MQNIKIASPLFIVREDAAKDLFGTLDKIAEAGFEGFELVGMFGKTAREIKAHADKLGMAVIGNHVSLDDLRADAAGVLDAHREMGCSYVTVGWPSRDMGPAHPDFEKALDDIGRAAEQITAAGMTPLYHNHDFEIAEPEWIKRLLAACAPKGLKFEPDLGWIAFAGGNPADYLRDYADICPVLHFKDVYAQDYAAIGPGSGLSGKECDPQQGSFAFRPTGYGQVNFPSLMPLSLACKPAWIVADHDCAYARDAYAELKISLKYIKELLELYA